MGRVDLNRKRVVIVDDSRTMQALLEQMLSVRLGCEIVGIAADGKSAIQMINRLKPDLVTIDLAMPYINGNQLLKEIQHLTDMKKIVISTTARDNIALKASLERMGADGCLFKNDMSANPVEFCRVLASMAFGPKKAPTPKPRPVFDAMASIVGYPVPIDEQERLNTLAKLSLANDDPDHRLDLLTAHLGKTTSFPACIITFIDRQTQWVKSGYGFERGPMMRSQAICNYTICGDEPLIIADTSTDKRFAALDCVLTGPMIRSYVGHPIVDSSGVRLGAICLLDTKPRRVTFSELTNLRSIALIAAELIEIFPVSTKRVA